MSKKPVIGIVGKPQCDDVIWNKICVSNEIKDALNSNGALAIGIIPQFKIKEIKEGKPFSYQNYHLTDEGLQDLYDTIDLCDGIVLEGGIVICDYEQEVARYCKEKDIPLLGICCGCINMALASGGSLSFENYDYLKEHHFSLENMKMHNVKINDDSKLYELIKSSNFSTNSIHKCKFTSVGDYDIKGYADDGVIELIEDNTRIFNIGVQWHPELIYSSQPEQNEIFKQFIRIVSENKK